MRQWNLPGTEIWESGKFSAILGAACGRLKGLQRVWDPLADPISGFMSIAVAPNKVGDIILILMCI